VVELAAVEVAEWVVVEWAAVVEAEWVVVVVAEYVAAEWAVGIKLLVEASSPAPEQNAATSKAGIGL